jgi:hypothetical protein
MQKVDEKIVNRLQLVQQTYLDDYKQQVKSMSEELQILRTNLDAEVLYQKCTLSLMQPMKKCTI